MPCFDLDRIPSKASPATNILSICSERLTITNENVIENDIH